ncbi:hypothetical protein RND81_10G183100 [Saponaria officinalis]|uniref:AP2/ERF domain-containing protein n=1 Tax=Saponaria officinalis TaxID=3572 RepID=A0AAW1I3Z4_SAPOF
MLFDLNIDDEKERETSINTQLSNTSSTSSIVNALEESPFSDNLITHQLFPATACAAVNGGRDRDAEVHVVVPNQWLNLSVSGSEKKQVRKSRRGPRSRSSQYRGVTFYRRTGRWESHIWDCGKQVYLGGFDTAHAAARAYDRAAIKFRGVDADINFNITDYDDDMKQEVKNLSKEEFVQVLRQNTGLSRGNSRFRGVTRPKCDLWQSQMPQFLGNKAYDQAAIQRNAEIPIVANNEGRGHNLDLNLGISITIDGPKASNIIMGERESRTYSSPIQLASETKPMNRASPYYSSAAVPQPLVSRQPTTMLSGLPTGRPANYEKNWASYTESQGEGGTIN